MSESPQPYFIMGEHHPLPAMDTTVSVHLHPHDMETIKQYIAEQVHATLHPTLPGLPDVHHFLRVEATDEQGKRWRGMLYAVEEEV